MFADFFTCFHRELMSHQEYLLLGYIQNVNLMTVVQHCRPAYHFKFNQPKMLTPNLVAIGVQGKSPAGGSEGQRPSGAK